METKKLLGNAVGVAVSLALLFGMVYVASKAWQKGQEKKGL
jgi:hypothetical protein